MRTANKQTAHIRAIILSWGCVVFLSIALTHSFDDNPYLFVFNRVLDTFIGIGVGLAVNNFHLPVRHDSETLYVSGIDCQVSFNIDRKRRKKLL